MIRHTIRSILLLTICLLWTIGAWAGITLPRLIRDGMVLQREADVPIWGWADAGEHVQVSFVGNVLTATANTEGAWEVMLSDLPVGGPYTMQVMGFDTITIRDILVGDVWICSGQSNMELTMERASPLYPEEIANCENPRIRYFQVPKDWDFHAPREDLDGGTWIAPSPETILQMSALSYFFGDALNTQYDIPVGLINTALGGSPAQAWISEEGLKAFPEYLEEAIRFRDTVLITRIRAEDAERRNTWYAEARGKDAGYANPDAPWHAPEVSTKGWKEMSVPGYWADSGLGHVNGVVWFRRDFEIRKLPAGAADGKLRLGCIVDADATYINGHRVGNTTYQYPPRRYTVPAHVLGEGTNTITVRVINEQGRGGFVPDKPYDLQFGGQVIDLKGKWKYQVGTAMDPLPGQTFIRWKPLGLYNAMIAPLTQYRIRGAIWYQGESNTSKPQEYGALLTTLIGDWRDKWQQGRFPFLIVQLPNFMEAKEQPSESNWARLREEQLQMLEVPNTGLAVAIDLGEWNDIHPWNKKDVAKRLLLAARHVAYGEQDLVYSGPLFESMKIDGNRLGLHFKHTGGDLVTGDGAPPGSFAIAGQDRRFVWANACIEGDRIVVWNDEVPDPVAVRYAWADNPVRANLYNAKGLPASPFRTDVW